MREKVKTGQRKGLHVVVFFLLNVTMLQHRYECMLSHASIKETPACIFQICTADQSSVSVLSAHKKVGFVCQSHHHKPQCSRTVDCNILYSTCWLSVC